jgi:hypothetical protein
MILDIALGIIVAVVLLGALRFLLDVMFGIGLGTSRRRHDKLPNVEPCVHGLDWCERCEMEKMDKKFKIEELHAQADPNCSCDVCKSLREMRQQFAEKR